MIRPVDDLLAGSLSAPRAAPPVRGGRSTGFAVVLESRMNAARDVRFSAHALKRLEDRDIALSAADRGRLSDAVDALGKKGGRDSLVLLDTVALVVSVPNRTVITAVPTAELGANIFTHIDSAVVLGSAAPHMNQGE